MREDKTPQICLGWEEKTHLLNALLWPWIEHSLPYETPEKLWAKCQTIIVSIVKKFIPINLNIAYWDTGIIPFFHHNKIILAKKCRSLIKMTFIVSLRIFVCIKQIK